jgi:putative two-component system response regulator
MGNKILIVDDEAANLRLMERLFRNQYNVFLAASGAEALEILKLHDVALIITDQRMSEMTGVEFLKKAAEMRPRTVRIILTGYTDINSLIEAINSGVVYKYVTKPWVNEDLQLTVVKALQHYETVKSNNELERQNQRMQLAFRRTLESFGNIIVQMLALKSPDLPHHCQRTRDYAVAIGQKLNFGPEELEQLSFAALLHEVANIGIPQHILIKTTEWTPGERQLAKKSFEKELQILADIPELEDIGVVIRYQHERLDGSGFPSGLYGKQIPVHSRIIAIANKFDELTAPGQFPVRTKAQAFDILQIEAVKKFDPEIVRVFCGLDQTVQPIKRNPAVEDEQPASLTEISVPTV